MAAAVDGGDSNGFVAAVIDDNNDVMALEAMATLTNSGGGDVGCCCRLCSGS